MKIFQKWTYVAFLALLLTSINSYSQNSEPIDFTNNKLISAAREIMSTSETCALISLDDEGRARVRAMETFSPEEDLTVWFGTNSNSRKVEQIRKDPRVTLYYLEEDASSYVMIHGIAQLVDDPEEKENRWKEGWEAYYPNKSENYLLIKVSPIWMEISSNKRGIVGDTITWQPPIIVFDSNQK